MAQISLDSVDVEIPVYNSSNRSLKSLALQIATGGKLCRDARGHLSVRALHNLTFTISEGERVGLVGHNGAGKSTLLRVLTGIYHPTQGTARLDGNIGSLIDLSLGIDPESTGRENIMMRSDLLGIKDSVMRLKLEEVVEFSELGSFIDMPVRTYSTGMHLRLAFSVSTILRPEILLMDEWLSVGDESFRNKAEKRIRSIVDSTKILVIASHSRDLITKTCNRVLWLEKGTIKMDAPTKTVCDAYFGCNS